MASLKSRWSLTVLFILAPIILSLHLAKHKFPAFLSDGALLLYPGSKEFANATQRWSAADSPNYSLIVQVATESDVQKTVSLSLWFASHTDLG